MFVVAEISNFLCKSEEMKREVFIVHDALGILTIIILNT